VVSISNENLTIAGQRVTSASGGLTFGDLYSYRAGAGGFEFHSAERAGATIQPYGSAAIVSSDGNTIRAYHPASLKILASIPVKAGTAAMSADYSRLAWCAKPGATGYSLFIAETPAFRAQRLASSRDGGCGPLQWTMADGEPGLAMEQGPTLTVHVYPVPNGQERIVDIQGAALNGILAFALDPDGETAAIVTNSEFELVDVRKHSVLRKLPSSFGPSQLQFSPDGRLIAAADRDGEVALVELGKDDNRSTILAPLDSSVTALAFSGDGRLLAVLSNTGGCQIYDAASGELLARIRPVPGTQTLFVEAPDGRFDAPREVWTRIFRNTQGGIVPLSDRPDGYTTGLLGLLLRGPR
jgi:WD40 repeat protein